MQCIASLSWEMMKLLYHFNDKNLLYLQCFLSVESQQQFLISITVCKWGNFLSWRIDKIEKKFKNFVTKKKLQVFSSFQNVEKSDIFYNQILWNSHQTRSKRWRAPIFIYETSVWNEVKLFWKKSKSAVNQLKSQITQ